MLVNSIDSIYEESFQNLDVMDIVEFKAINIESTVRELQNYFNNIDIFELNKNSLLLPISSVPNILDNYLLENSKNNLVIYLDSSLNKDCEIASIALKVNEDYSYREYSEYDLRGNTMKTFDERQVIDKCLAEEKDCSYIERYSYSIYLEVALK